MINSGRIRRPLCAAVLAVGLVLSGCSSDGDDGGPTADDWARAVGTINYEIVTRLGCRVPRVHVGAAGTGEDA